MLNKNLSKGDTIMAKYSGQGWHFQSTRHSNARKYGKADVYNVWIITEKINDKEEVNGTDIDAIKVARFKKEKQALKFAKELGEENDTPRDKNDFTIK
jgi:hypothetical protein